MQERARYLCFSVLVADGWTADVRGTKHHSFLKVVPDAGDVALSLSLVDLAKLSFEASQWPHHVAQFNRRRKRAVHAAACGDFSGYNVQSEVQGKWSNYWALHSGDAAIEVNYWCPLRLRQRDDDVVCEMLSTLQFEPSESGEDTPTG